MAEKNPNFVTGIASNSWISSISCCTYTPPYLVQACQYHHSYRGSGNSITQSVTEVPIRVPLLFGPFYFSILLRSMNTVSIPLAFPCVDCGLLTGNFCDGGITTEYDKCFAAERCPQDFGSTCFRLSAYSGGTQRTPLCSYCETSTMYCRYCRGEQGCTPPVRNIHWSGIPLNQSRAFSPSVCNRCITEEWASKCTKKDFPY